MSAVDPVAWYEDEAGFAAELARGRRDELRVAMRLLPLGKWLRVGAFFFREGRAGDDPRCAEQADIEIEGGHLLEVKGRGFAFTGPADYPYDTAYLGARRRWQARQQAMPCCVVLLSETTDALVVVPTATCGMWAVEERRDSRRGFLEESLAAPRDLLLPEERLITHLSKPCPYRTGDYWGEEPPLRIST